MSPPHRRRGLDLRRRRGTAAPPVRRRAPGHSQQPGARGRLSERADHTGAHYFARTNVLPIGADARRGQRSSARALRHLASSLTICQRRFNRELYHRLRLHSLHCAPPEDGAQGRCPGTFSQSWACGLATALRCQRRCPRATPLPSVCGSGGRPCAAHHWTPTTRERPGTGTVGKSGDKSKGGALRASCPVDLYALVVQIEESPIIFMEFCVTGKSFRNKELHAGRCQTQGMLRKRWTVKQYWN